MTPKQYEELTELFGIVLAIAFFGLVGLGVGISLTIASFNVEECASEQRGETT